MPVTPLLSIVIVSYNRVEYLRQLLTSLLEQDSVEPYELVLLDNGSETPLEAGLSGLLSRIPGPVTLIREEHNLLSPARWRRAAELAQGCFVLTPGDDDLLLPHYLRTMSDLARSGPDVTMISGTVQFIDSDGRRLGGRVTPPAFGSQPEALGRLISRDDYPMPGSGYRRDGVDLSNAPRTRTAFDWWLWTQCWLAGSAAVTDEPVVLYRQHAGQEQRHYGTQSFRADAARMLLALLHSKTFQVVIDSWTPEELDLFVRTVLRSAGPNYGDTRWGPLVQMALAGLLRDRIPASMTLDLHAQAAAQSGGVASVGDLQALIGAPITPPRLPGITWSRVPITATWASSCEMTTAWTDYLQLPRGEHSTVKVAFQCSCQAKPRGDHHLAARLVRKDAALTLTIQLNGLPTDAAAAPLLEAIGSLKGRPHGFEIPATTDLKVLDAFNRFRASGIGAALERSARWWRRNRRKSDHSSAAPE